MLLTMAAVAAAKGFSMPDMDVRLSAEMRLVSGQPAHTVIRSVLTSHGPLSPRERAILFNSARQCEVHKLLSGQVEFEEQMEPA